MEDNQNVTFDVEGTLIKCKKIDLVEKSDYFKVMLHGDFIEKDTNIIKLQDVDLNSFNIILKTLWDESYLINDEDLLTVLQTASMLQFNHIKSNCIEKITELLSPINCLTIWQITEQLDIKPLNLKAKAMSLVEFEIIKDLDCLLELNINQLFKYLSNTKLRTINEFHVFECCMKWFYENNKKEKLCENFDKNRIFKIFMACIDFKTISDGFITEMLLYPDLNNEIVCLLGDILKIKDSNLKEIDYDDESLRFFNNCKQRESFYSPCLVIDSFPRSFKRQKISSMWYYENSPEMSNASTSKIILLYDVKIRDFCKLINIPHEKHSNLQGFELIGYKELLFLFGGEISLGKGNWNNNFWVYNTICDRWERKSKLPFERRHFETCISNDVLYIVGGTGSFRIIQDNMFYYKYKTNEWSKTQILPCAGRQVKCCDFQQKLFLLNINGKCGYLFDLNHNRWIQLPIYDNNIEVIYPNKFSLFSYEDKIYLKGTRLITMNVKDNKLVLEDNKYLNSILYDQIDSVICNDLVYTLYTETVDDKKRVGLEKFDLKSLEKEIIFEKLSENSFLDLNEDVCLFRENIKLFNFQHFSMVENDDYVGDYNL
ncbi:kelch-like protein 6 isoform X2 [Onthophagus taurus]|uniref:kelch-like protein 6 isoform X2 n=1 Tax=Onthophagus taurus TaxID=166361 RepID=UPI000C204452|nr:kelch-like protein 38 isoform X2 [Onthophagus taurus]